jgi:hypothetical protein
VLEKRALRYRSKFSGLEDLHSGDNIDETGTVSTEGLTDSESDCDSDSISFNNNKSIRQSEIESIKGVNEEILKVHGVAPGAKAEGVTRLLYENPDGFNTRLSNNAKLDKSKELIDDLEADIVATTGMVSLKCFAVERPKFARLAPTTVMSDMSPVDLKRVELASCYLAH